MLMNELELRSNVTLGKLESNAEQIKEFVLKKLTEYTPENYIGKAAEAKADRAVLNNAEKALNSKRLEIEREYMLPFDKFKAIITDTCKAIKQASSKLDEIVKGEESREKEQKRNEIESYWDSLNFSLFSIDKVFDCRWLNKGTKLKDVHAEIDQIIQRTFNDLQIIEKFPAEDVSLLKTVYLESLSITDAIQAADKLKQNRERLAQEQKERELQAQRRQLEEQAVCEKQETREMERHKAMAALAADSLGLEIKTEPAEELETYTCVFTGTAEELINLRKYMTFHNITYTKLTDKGSGLYTKEIE